MLGIARGSTYCWIILVGIAAIALYGIRPAHSEDYGAGLFAIAIAIGASVLCLLLALTALAAFILARRRREPFLRRDKALALVSFVALAAFAWPVSWLVG